MFLEWRITAIITTKKGCGFNQEMPNLGIKYAKILHFDKRYVINWKDEWELI